MSAAETRYLWHQLKHFRPKLPGSCWFCDAKDDLTIHHIQPRSSGGTDELDNLSILCQTCHKKLHDTRRHRRDIADRRRRDIAGYFFSHLRPEIEALIIEYRRRENEAIAKLFA